MSIPRSFKIACIQDLLYVEQLAAIGVTSAAVDVFTSVRRLYELGILILYSNSTQYSRIINSIIHPTKSLSKIILLIQQYFCSIILDSTKHCLNQQNFMLKYIFQREICEIIKHFLCVCFILYFQYQIFFN